MIGLPVEPTKQLTATLALVLVRVPNTPLPRLVLQNKVELEPPAQSGDKDDGFLGGHVHSETDTRAGVEDGPLVLVLLEQRSLFVEPALGLEDVAVGSPDGRVVSHDYEASKEVR